MRFKLWKIYLKGVDKEISPLLTAYNTNKINYIIYLIWVY